MSELITVDIDYAIALQRAIEYHCKGKVVPDEIARECPYHAEMLNKNLAAQQSVHPTLLRCPKCNAVTGWHHEACEDYTPEPQSG